jgi:uncharacterized membrane protein YeiH
MQIDSLVTALDLIATFAFAIVGARIAANKGLDYGGIALIAAVASISGGTLRNLFMGQRPPWILHSWLFASIALAVLITVIAKEKKLLKQQIELSNLPPEDEQKKSNNNDSKKRTITAEVVRDRMRQGLNESSL